jgi:hypothetical protein
MLKYFFGWMGLALLSGGPLLWQASALGGEAGCCSQAACGTEAGWGGGACCDPCCQCCPHCGCRLVPVCHTYCETKKTTEHQYCQHCKDLCIPGIIPCCQRGCDSCDTCNNGCNSGCNNGCEDCCGRCRVRQVHQLVVYPKTKESCVRKCTVEWVCPQCGGGCNCGSSTSPAQPAAAPSPAAPAPLMPGPPKTTDLAPRLTAPSLVQMP